jgi:predicted nucleic acid-binding protein
VKYIVDASVAIKWFLQEEGREEAIDFYKKTKQILAPDFIIIEMMNILWKKKMRGEITEFHAQKIAESLNNKFDKLMSSKKLSKTAFKLSIELNHSIYDCLYLAMAVDLKAVFISADEKFVNKAIANGFDINVTTLNNWAKTSHMN